MLVVAKDKDHGGRIAKMINAHCHQNPDWRTYSVLEVYNDTDNAHARIAALENDRTDIIITVRMISEGVDVKRLRVGVYATDYRTRMFFVQFVGRFVRWEARLDGTQHGRVIIPAHIDLLIFAREIEQMIDDALIADESDGTGEPIEKKTELLGTQTERTNDGLIFSGKDEDDRSLADHFFKMFPSLIGKIPEFLAIQGAKDANLKGGEHSSAGNQAQKSSDWWKLNEQLVRAVVKTMRLNGDDDDQAYRKVNFAANKHAGIPRVDKLTDVDKMKVRHIFLKNWLKSLRKNDGECVDGY